MLSFTPFAGFVFPTALLHFLRKTSINQFGCGKTKCSSLGIYLMSVTIAYYIREKVIGNHCGDKYKKYDLPAPGFELETFLLGSFLLLGTGLLMVSKVEKVSKA